MTKTQVAKALVRIVLLGVALTFSLASSQPRVSKISSSTTAPTTLQTK